MTRRALFFLTSTGALGALSCGYHVGGKADLMPKTVQTIAIPAFGSLSTRYTLTDELPQEIGKEFKARTRFRIVENPAEADAVLHGQINNALTYPQIYDPTSGKATSVQILVFLSITLIEQKTGRVLYNHPNWAVRQNYQIAVDPHQFFNESSPALDRLSRDVAHDIVSSIVENF